jgi:hypothetical protein
MSSPDSQRITNTSHSGPSTGQFRSAPAGILGTVGHCAKPKPLIRLAPRWIWHPAYLLGTYGHLNGTGSVPYAYPR